MEKLKILKGPLGKQDLEDGIQRSIPLEVPASLHVRLCLIPGIALVLFICSGNTFCAEKTTSGGSKPSLKLRRAVILLWSVCVGGGTCFSLRVF